MVFPVEMTGHHSRFGSVVYAPSNNMDNANKQFSQWTSDHFM